MEFLGLTTEGIGFHRENAATIEDSFMANRYRKIAFVFALLVCGFTAQHVTAQTAYQPSPENLQARREFQDMKFGMFIHWGAYSVLGDGEWVFHNRKLKVDEYNRLPLFLDPEKFDARTWVSLAKAAGMKYITITSRHHDGFAMFDSKVSDWNIVQRTPYKKDPLKMLAEECRRQGIKLFFYYSQLDWHNPDYDPQCVTRLQAVGESLSKYGESIYGTRGGPIAPGGWGVTTQKDNKIYVHVLNWSAPLLALSPVAGKIASAQMLVGGSATEFTQNANGGILKLPAANKDEIDRVIVLTLAKAGA